MLTGDPVDHIRRQERRRFLDVSVSHVPRELLSRVHTDGRRCLAHKHSPEYDGPNQDALEGSGQEFPRFGEKCRRHGKNQSRSKLLKRRQT
jgi:hypothetical protein